MSALIGFGSALLAIVLTPMLQHYFWRRQRHAELSLTVIERCVKLVAELTERLPRIQETKEWTDADKDLFRRWEALSLETRSLFSKSTVGRFSKLSELVVEFSNPLRTGGFRISDFDSARIDAISALYGEIGLTGEQVTGPGWWKVWRP